MKTRLQEVTLAEILTVVGIFVLVSFVTVPIINRDQQTDQLVCQSNLKQIGLGLLEYAQDYNEVLPYSRIKEHLSGKAVTDVGWGSQLFPYIRSTELYRCPADSWAAAQVSTSGAIPISYAINSNLAGVTFANYNSPNRTVEAFEISHGSANVSEPEEGRYSGAAELSPAGNGVDGQLRASAFPMNPNASNTPIYATGKLDNSNSFATLSQTQYLSFYGRHRNGSVFLAADGHVRWLPSQVISAGANALSPQRYETRSGCQTVLDPARSIPCAEGTNVSVHVLTFSSN